jgi:mRNA interferase MazF
VLPLEGEIWDIALDPTVGDEIQKTRPCVIVSGPGINNLGLRVVVPLTGWKAETMGRRPWFVEIVPDSSSGLDKQSAAACHHVRSVSIQRLSMRRGRISAEDLESVRAALRIVLNLG